MTHVTSYYVGDDSTNRQELENFRGVLWLLNKLDGPTSAAAFGPRALKVVRQAAIDAGWARRYVNRQTGRLRHVFKSGVENELVPPPSIRGLPQYMSPYE